MHQSHLLNLAGLGCVADEIWGLSRNLQAVAVSLKMRCSVILKLCTLCKKLTHESDDQGVSNTTTPVISIHGR